jgi:hypothetical protein
MRRLAWLPAGLSTAAVVSFHAALVLAGLVGVVLLPVVITAIWTGKERREAALQVLRCLLGREPEQKLSEPDEQQLRQDCQPARRRGRRA